MTNVILSTLLVLVVYHQCEATVKSISYTVVSKITDGGACLNACRNNTCYYTKDLNEKACVTDLLAGVPTVFTVSGGTCLSNCGKFDNTDYNWCYTSESYNWDYCNPKVLSTHEFTGRTVYGEQCRNFCNGLCHTASQYYAVCAKPAKVEVSSSLAKLNEIAYANLRRLSRSRRSDVFLTKNHKDCTEACKLRIADATDGETLKRINEILYNSAFTFPVETITVFPPGSPYTFVATRNETNSLGVHVYLPLVVRATLRRTPAKRRLSSDVPREAAINCANMFDGDAKGRDTGHIVAFIFGGTRDLFNYVSQQEGTNRGPYKVMENMISEWLNSDNGYVEMSVAISYAGTTTTEFAIKLKFFNNDGSVHSDCRDFIIKNL